MAARDAAAEPSVQAHHIGGNLVRSLRQRWNPSRPRQETARCERLADDKMLSRQSPEDACPTRTRTSTVHPDADESLLRWYAREPTPQRLTFHEISLLPRH